MNPDVSSRISMSTPVSLPCVRQEIDTKANIDTFPINSLPTNLIPNIFECLPGKELVLATGKTSRTWNHYSIEALECGELTSIRSVAAFLSEHLDDAAQKKSLMEISQSTILNSKLLTMREWTQIRNWKESIVNILKNLPDENLKTLKKASPTSHFFTELFELVHFFTKLDQATRMTHEEGRTKILMETTIAFMKFFMKLSDLNQAITIQIMQTSPWLHAAFRKMLGVLVKEDLVDEAVEIAKTISNKAFQDSALASIVAALVRRVLFDPIRHDLLNQAFEITKTMTDEYCKAGASFKLTKALVKLALLDPSIPWYDETCYDEEDEGYQELALEIISDASKRLAPLPIKQGFLDKALQAAKIISSESDHLQSLALVKILNALVKLAILHPTNHDLLDKANQVATIFPREKDRKIALEKLSVARGLHQLNLRKRLKEII